MQEENISRTLDLVNKNLRSIEKLNVNGLSDKSQCLEKKLALLDKKLDLEQNRIKYQATRYKLEVLKDKSEDNL